MAIPFPMQTWWRHPAYFIREGRIEPERTDEATAYDPWEGFWVAGRGSHRASQRPYVELMNLVEKLKGCDPPDFALADDQEHELLSWCGRYGLLGIFPHECLLARGEVIRVGRERCQRQLVRHSGGWQDVYLEIDEEPGRNESVAVLQTLWGPEVVGFDSAWRPFFPDLSPPFEPLTPQSEFFWEDYVEPIGTFLEYATRLSQAINDLLQPKDALNRRHALWVLNSMASACTSELVETDRGHFALRWRSPSLIGTLAQMAMQDVLHRRFTARCPCGAFVASTHPDTRYCGPQHRELFRKRNQRASKAKGVRGRRRAEGARSRRKTQPK